MKEKERDFEILILGIGRDSFTNLGEALLDLHTIPLVFRIRTHWWY